MQSGSVSQGPPKGSSRIPAQPPGPRAAPQGSTTVTDQLDRADLKVKGAAACSYCSGDEVAESSPS